MSMGTDGAFLALYGTSGFARTPVDCAPPGVQSQAGKGPGFQGQALVPLNQPEPLRRQDDVSGHWILAGRWILDEDTSHPAGKGGVSAQRAHSAYMTGRNWGFFATIGNILVYTDHTTPPQCWTAS